MSHMGHRSFETLLLLLLFLLFFFIFFLFLSFFVSEILFFDQFAFFVLRVEFLMGILCFFWGGGG